MADTGNVSVDLLSSRNTIDTAIRIGLVAVLFWGCFTISKPFLAPVLWAIIIAVAVYPLYGRLETLLGGRRKLAVTLFTLFVLGIVVVPSIKLMSSLVDTVQTVAERVEQGDLTIPPPSEKVAEWPFIGSKLHKIWLGASTNLTATLEQFNDQLKELGKWVLLRAANAGLGVLQFIVSVLIAAVFIVNAASAERFSNALAVRVIGEEGRKYAALAGATMRSVAQGILGVAIIQGVLAGLGMLVMDVPGAGLWALLVLLLAIMQLPPLLILGPVALYVFSVADTVPAVIFTVYAIVVGMSDAFLKPLFLGRGVDVPMLVVLIGAIGGMIVMGIIGLFIGAVMLALGYKLFMIWLMRESAAEMTDSIDSSPS